MAVHAVKEATVGQKVHSEVSCKRVMSLQDAENQESGERAINSIQNREEVCFSE